MEIMQPRLSKNFVPHMVKVLFQNIHVENDSQGSEKEISIYPMKVLQAELPTIMKRQFEVIYRKMQDKVLGHFISLCVFYIYRVVQLVVVI